MAENTVTTKALRLGAAIRQEREEALGLSLSKFAVMVDLSKSTLSRIETGQALPKRDQLGKIAHALGIKGDRYDKLIAMLDGADAIQWLATTLGDQAQQQAAMVAAEAEADWIVEGAALLVPATSQIDGYARAIMSGGTIPPSEIAARVAMRMGRRDVIDPNRRANPTRYTALIDEAVLHRIVGSPEIMVDQLTHLLEVASWPHTAVHVVPLDAGWTRLASGPFTYLERGDAGSPIVYLGSRRSTLILHAKDDVTEYRETVDSVLQAAMLEPESAELIAAVRDEMRRK